MLERFEHSDGLGAIYPPIVWSIVALRCLGYADDSPEVQRLPQAARRPGASRTTRPTRSGCSPASRRSGTRRSRCGRWRPAACGRDDPAMRRAVDWLLDKQIRRPGDWSETVDAEPGGWCFEYANDFYPDVRRHGHGPDGPADAVRRRPPRPATPCRPTCALADDDERRRTTDGRRWPDRPRDRRRSTAGCDWMLAMQNDDGGWGAFDRNNDRRVPLLRAVRRSQRHDRPEHARPDRPRARRPWASWAAAWAIRPWIGRSPTSAATQEADGSWFGRWGVNYIYGTWQALAGLAERGRAGRRSGRGGRAPTGSWPTSSPAAAGANRPTATTIPHLRGQGPPTASQTAWAVLGLLAAGLARPSGRRPRRPVTCVDAAARRRHLGRARVHRHRLPARVLPALPLLPDLLPAAGPVAVGPWPPTRRWPDVTVPRRPLRGQSSGR